MMDAELLQHLGDHPSAAGQQQALLYFEQLKNSDEGWRQCISLLTSSSAHDDRVKFFSFQVIEHFIKTNYALTSNQNQNILREFLSQWIQIQCMNNLNEKKFIRNKAAQMFSLVFVRDYPVRWPSFLTDLIQTLTLGPQAVDNYLRVLMAIDTEVTDRDISHTPQELERNAAIKDAMRESDVGKLVDSWFQILDRYQSSHACLSNQCLQVIGAYISWIDISLIANDQFVPLLVQQLLKPDLRESAADCVHDIISKGMEPLQKAKLVESFVIVLASAGVLKPLKDDETDYSVKMSKLMNGIGMNLIDSYNKMLKAGNTRVATELQSAIECKIDTLLEFLSNDYDDVSAAVIEFAREYIHMMKCKVLLTAVQKNHAANLLVVVINKMKYDETYNFESEGEDEATFIEYRKQLKVLFDNLTGLDKEMVLDYTEKFVSQSLQQWQTLSFVDVELAITFLYYIGEAIPATGGNHFSGDQLKSSTMRSMMHILVTSGVVNHPHPAVKLQFFETIVRYEKFFNSEPDHIGNILTTFLDENGMRNNSCKVRSRCAYLFSRLVKSLKGHMQSYTKQVLHMMKDLLTLSAPVANNGLVHSPLSDDDQLYVYEACGILIVSGGFTPQEKELFMRELLSPLLSKFSLLVDQLMNEPHDKRREMLANCLCHAMALTSRTSKAFSNQQTMKLNGCVQVYVDALQVFLACLQVPHEQHCLQSGVRQFLHRMVVCLEDELLPYIPTASQGLLKSSDVSSFQEYVPLLIQIITKFKKEIVPFLQQAFMPIVNAIINALAAPVEENDEQARREQQLLQRHYFQFIAAIVTNNLTRVLETQESHCLEQVMSSVIRGAVDFPDPVAQKTCFCILKKLVELWGNKEASPNGFVAFMYKNIVPACFLAPMKSSFDLTDAQTLIALGESAACMKAVYNTRGEELISYLTQLFPTLNLNLASVEEYCQALKADTKVFKTFLKFFFQRVKT